MQMQELLGSPHQGMHVKAVGHGSVGPERLEKSP